MLFFKTRHKQHINYGDFVCASIDGVKYPHYAYAQQQPAYTTVEIESISRTASRREVALCVLLLSRLAISAPHSRPVHLPSSSVCYEWAVRNTENRRNYAFRSIQFCICRMMMVAYVLRFLHKFLPVVVPPLPASFPFRSAHRANGYGIHTMAASLGG